MEKSYYDSLSDCDLNDIVGYEFEVVSRLIPIFL